MVWRPQVSFRNGEVTPALDGMANPEVYETSCRKLEGAVVTSRGTVEKRCGSTYVADTQFSYQESGGGTQTLTSLACKLIPFRSKTEIIVLVFEVLKDASDVKFGTIRVAVNNQFKNTIGEVTPSATGTPWAVKAICDLPFRSVTGDDDIKYFLPPGVSTGSATNLHTRYFGMHNFTEAQLPELQYFQYEDVVTVLHPDAFPIQILDTESGLISRPYEVEGRSPEIDIRGERYTLTATPASGQSSNTTGEITVVSTRDVFDIDDVGHIYRLNNWVWNPYVTDAGTLYNSGYGKNVETGDGNFFRIKRVEGKRQAVVETILNMDGGQSPADKFAVVLSDPDDWDGPWVQEDTTAVHADVELTSRNSGSSVGINDTSKKWFSTDISRASTVTTGGLITGMTLNQLVGCLIETQDGRFVSISDVYSTDGTTPSNDSTGAALGVLYNSVNIGGSGVNTGSFEDARVYRLRDKKGSLRPVFKLKNLEVTTVADYSGARIKEGDKVLIYVGNVTGSQVPEHVPTNHETAWDTLHRGIDVITSAPQTEANRIDLGGVIHVNGGTFALKSRHDNAFIAYCITAPTNTSFTTKYSLGWSHAVGFPGVGTTHQGRVLFAGFKSVAQAVVGSVPDEPSRFALGGSATDGFHFLVNDLRGSRVRFLKSTQDLVVGTETGEFSIKGSPLSAISAGVDRQSSYGSSHIPPVMAGTYLLFVQKDKKTVRAMRYIDDRQRYMSMDITADHAHFFNNATIEEMLVWETREDPVVIMRLSDGETLAVRVSENQGFFGWSKLKLPSVTSMCPSRNYAPAAGATSSGDDFYYAVDAGDHYRLSRYDDSVMLDETVEMAAATTTTLTFPADESNGVKTEHLDGQTVSVVIDGVYRGDFTVTAGAPSTIAIGDIGLSSPPTTAYVGKKIPMKVQPRVPETGLAARAVSTLGRVKNYSSVIVNLNNGRAVKVNNYEADGSIFATKANDVAEHTLLQGWYEVPVTGLYGVQPLLEISSDRPYPVEIAGVTIDVSVEG